MLAPLYSMEWASFGLHHWKVVYVNIYKLKTRYSEVQNVAFMRSLEAQDREVLESYSQFPATRYDAGDF